MRASFFSAVPMKGSASEMKQRDGGVLPIEMLKVGHGTLYEFNRKASR